MKFIIHRGTHEIGGSCVEVFSKNGSRILIDFGMPLTKSDGSKFEPKELDGLTAKELIWRGVLYTIDGIYKAEPCTIDGVLISHPHIDHYGFFEYLHPDIHYFIGQDSKKLIDLTLKFTNIKGEIRNCLFIKSGESFYIKDFKITPYLVDHSAFDSYAFLIEADGKKLFYSGDFRAHGRKTRVFEWFLKNGPEDVDVLLMEGTMLGRADEKIMTEKDIEDKATEIFRNSPNIVLLYLSGQNIDRFVSFYRAAIKAKKTLVVDVYVANILNELKDSSKIPYPSAGYSDIRVCFPPIYRKLDKEGNKDLIYKFKKYKITKQEIAKNRKNIVMLMRPSMIKFLDGIGGLENCAFIYSMWQGYLKEDKSRALQDFIKRNNMAFYHLHTSGHAPVETLKKLREKLKPGVTIPIHTAEPKKYREIFGDGVRMLSDGEMFEVQKSNPTNPKTKKFHKICPKCYATGTNLYLDEKMQEWVRRCPNAHPSQYLEIDDYEKCPFCNTLLEKKSEKQIKEQLEKRIQKQTEKELFKNIKNILRYIPLFETAKPESLYKIPEPTKNETGETTLSAYYDYAPEVDKFTRALYRNNVILTSFKWTDWKEGEKYFKNPTLIQNADTEDLQKLLTTIIRNERFCAGVIASAIDNGMILAILKNLKSKINI